jgi:hypothetical protein
MLTVKPSMICLDRLRGGVVLWLNSLELNEISSLLRYRLSGRLKKRWAQRGAISLI